MNGIRSGNRVLQAEGGLKIASGEEVIGLANDAAIFEGFGERVAAAAVNADRAAAERRAGLGGDVENAAGVEAVAPARCRSAATSVR